MSKVKKNTKTRNASVAKIEPITDERPRTFLRAAAFDRAFLWTNNSHTRQVTEIGAKTVRLKTATGVPPERPESLAMSIVPIPPANRPATIVIALREMCFATMSLLLVLIMSYTFPLG